MVKGHDTIRYSIIHKMDIHYGMMVQMEHPIIMKNSLKMGRTWAKDIR